MVYRYLLPNATYGRNQMELMEGHVDVGWRDALRSRPSALGTRPRRSVVLQVT